MPSFTNTQTGTPQKDIGQAGLCLSQYCLRFYRPGFWTLIYIIVPNSKFDCPCISSFLKKFISELWSFVLVLKSSVFHPVSVCSNIRTLKIIFVGKRVFDVQYLAVPVLGRVSILFFLFLILFCLHPKSKIKDRKNSSNRLVNMNRKSQASSNNWQLKRTHPTDSWTWTRNRKPQATIGSWNTGKQEVETPTQATSAKTMFPSCPSGTSPEPNPFPVSSRETSLSISFLTTTNVHPFLSPCKINASM